MSRGPDSVIVVGGGLAGVTTCIELRGHGYPGSLTLIDTGDSLYDRPPLSKGFLAGESSAEQIALRPESWFGEHDVVVRIRTTVTAIHPGPDGVGVVVADGPALTADVVVLALGGTARPLTVPGAAHPEVRVLRTIEDARRLRDRLRPGRAIGIIGAGLIGAEVASTACQLDVRVTLIDPVDPPLLAAVGPTIARFLHDDHVAHGIRVITGAVTAIEADGNQLRVLIDPPVADPVVVNSVLVGIGIIAPTDIAQRAGLLVDRGVVVDAAHRSSHPRVYAAGDVVRPSGPDGRLRPRTEHWDAAQRGGQIVAASILGRPRPPDSAPWFWSDRHGRHVEGVGVVDADARTVVRGRLGAGPYAEFVLDETGCCLGAVSVDDAMAVRAARRMIDRHIRVDADRLADESVDLRSLLRG